MIATRQPLPAASHTKGAALVASCFGMLLWLWSACTRAAADIPPLPQADPNAVGMEPVVIASIDAAVNQAVREGKLPGCVVAIGRQGKLAVMKAYGHRRVEPAAEPMAVDTVFDLASLTKPVATATSVLLLAEEGKIRLEDPVARYLPEFGSKGKDSITVWELLVHQGGLVADNPLADYLQGPAKAWQRIFDVAPVAPPGTKFIYSDVGYMVLGKLVERVSGQGLDEFARVRIFLPLGMQETGFRPPEPLRRRAAPADRRDGRWIQGEVHDPRAYYLGGVAGHAGLFSTAEDLARYAQMLLGRGQYAGRRVLSPETVQRMTCPYPVSAGLRGLGWDIRTGYSTNRGLAMSARAFGHGGFTGTALWVDPELDLFVIFLSNRLHPAGKGEVNRLAGQIGDLAARACRRPASPVPRPVLCGIDVLQRDGFGLLRGRRVGLITNQTGLSRQGRRTADLLHEAPEVKLVALFSPEHGWEGKLDTARVPDTRDSRTGLPVYSLYGSTRKPTPEMLRGLDTLVFDIQDIGTRFYTYIATMGLAMEAAAEHRLRFVVLDRPNPITGRWVAGPVLDAGRESFVGYHRLPVRHGMTVGELALLFAAERKLRLELEVVRLEGWRRDYWFDATGLPWVNPSPNMRSLTEAILYPGIGLLETTNLSVGRGTETPFEMIGAPWLDGPRLARHLNDLPCPGARFEPVRFTPQSSTFAGKECSGVRVVLVDRQKFEPLRTGLEIAVWLRANYPQTWNAKAYLVLLGNSAAHEALLGGKSAAEIEAGWQPDLSEFIKRRQRFLLYDIGQTGGRYAAPGRLRPVLPGAWKVRLSRVLAPNGGCLPLLGKIGGP